jgi:GAF domain-containing protein
MATSRLAGICKTCFSWPDLTAGSDGEPLETDLESCLRRERLVRARALAETSAAFSAGQHSIRVVCRELADRVAKVLAAACLIRPLSAGAEDLPVALGQVRDRFSRELATLVEANPQVLAGACSARAAEMDCSILLPEMPAKCLRLWSDQAAWACLDKLRVSSMLVTPVRASSRPVGSMLVWRQKPAGPLHADDQLFVEEVARRLACAYL